MGCEVDDTCENGKCFHGHDGRKACRCRKGYYGSKCDKHINDYLGLCENNCVDSDKFCYKDQTNSTYCSSITKVALSDCAEFGKRNCTTDEICLVFGGKNGYRNNLSCE